MYERVTAVTGSLAAHCANRRWKLSSALRDVACGDYDELFILANDRICVIHASGAVLGRAMRYAAVLMDLAHCCYSTVMFQVY